MTHIPFRQIHMDFHTSPYIEGIGSDFNAEDFALTLKNANVNSVNVFAKCHHGFCYFPTKVGKIHPHLDFDLLGEMIRACHQQGIRVPVYITVGFDEEAATSHPEWQEVNLEGVIGGKIPYTYEHYSWQKICHSHPGVIQQVLDLSLELLKLYDVDALWYDIVFQNSCVCSNCRKSMQALGLNPQAPKDLIQHSHHVMNDFRKIIGEAVHEKKPDLPIFFNTGYNPNIGLEKAASVRNRIHQNTHMEIESVPSGKWGYNHFPIASNYMNALNLEYLGMTGKFLKCWGDFGTLKNQAALEYECFRMLADGAKCCIGDQLHPSGKIDAAVYERIGNVYQSVAEKERWCIDTIKISDIGIFTSNSDWTDDFNVSLSDEGVMRMMLELHLPFDFIDAFSDLEKYRLLIMPDSILLDEALTQKVNVHLKNGGKLILTGQSGLKTDLSDFALEAFGVSYGGVSEFEPDYIRLKSSFFKDIPEMDYCFYEKGIEIKPLSGSEVIAEHVNPYFNRSFEKFCSHCQTPSTKQISSPAIIRNESVIYISKPIFKDYIKSGATVYRDMILKCIQKLCVHLLFRSNLPTTAEITLRQQGKHIIVHILNYVPQRKCRETEIIEDPTPLYYISIAVLSQTPPKACYLVPCKTPISFDYQAPYTHIALEQMCGHQMIVIEQ